MKQTQLLWMPFWKFGTIGGCPKYQVCFRQLLSVALFWNCPLEEYIQRRKPLLRRCQLQRDWQIEKLLRSTRIRRKDVACWSLLWVQQMKRTFSLPANLLRLLCQILQALVWWNWLLQTERKSKLKKTSLKHNPLAAVPLLAPRPTLPFRRVRRSREEDERAENIRSQWLGLVLRIWMNWSYKQFWRAIVYKISTIGHRSVVQ